MLLKKETASTPEKSPPAVHSEEEPASDGDLDREFARHIKLAKNANRSNEFRLAVDEYRKALELKPQSADAKAGLGIALVNSDPGLSGYAEAVKLLQQSLKSQNNPRAWLALGMAYQFTRKEEQAVNAYKQYLLLEPTGEPSQEVRAMLKQLAP
jgi:Flp pilus assembly protein TadD